MKKELDYKEIKLLQEQIKFLKDKFLEKICKKLQLDRVSAPLFVTKESGLNDDLSGKERQVEFDTLEDKKQLQVVSSLAKWKRFALGKYHYPEGVGLITDMNAIRCDETMDAIHSIYVDQWDWEKVVSSADRTLTFLKSQVKKIVGAIFETSKLLEKIYHIVSDIKKDVFFVTSEELLSMYPKLSPKEREYAIVKEHKTVCLLQIGYPLSHGEKHDERAPDYDDWKLNCDIMFYDKTLDIALEISSMGIRVDDKSLKEQLIFAKKSERLSYPYHKAILQKDLPLTIGGGIGQSRLAMLLLNKHHIGEVQVSYWSEKQLAKTRQTKLTLL